MIFLGISFHVFTAVLLCGVWYLALQHLTSGQPVTRLGHAYRAEMLRALRQQGLAGRCGVSVAAAESLAMDGRRSAA